MNVEFSRLTVSAPRSSQRCSRFCLSYCSPKDFVQGDAIILNEISGCCKAGEMLALMGPSGCGKSSLLNVLSGATRMTVTGEILINDTPCSKSKKSRIGYVAQQEVFFPNLTVYQTLMYTALIRLGSTISVSEKLARVEVVIEILELQSCRDTKVGSPLKRGISGGELKRLSVGREMLLEPRVLLLDEPTSGLDARAATNLVRCFENTAKKLKQTIICSIHQPSTQVFMLYSKVLLLMQGNAVYFGATLDVADYFASVGFVCPAHHSIAEFMLEIVNNPANFPLLSALYRQRLRRNQVDGYYMSTNVSLDVSPPVTDYKKLESPTAADLGSFRHIASANANVIGRRSKNLEIFEDGNPKSGISRTCPDTSCPTPVVNSKDLVISRNDCNTVDATCMNAYTTKRQYETQKKHIMYRLLNRSDYFSKVYTLCIRCFVNNISYIKDKYLIAQYLLLFLVWGGITYKAFGRFGEKSLGIKLAFVYFYPVLWSLLSIGDVMSLIFSERDVTARELASSAYPHSAYILSKVVSNCLLYLILPTILFIIVYFLTSIGGSVEGIVVGLCPPFCATCTNWSCLTFGCCQVTLLLFHLNHVACQGGFLVLPEDLPTWIGWTRHLAVTKYISNAVAIITIKPFEHINSEPSAYETHPIQGDEALAKLYPLQLSLWCNIAIAFSFYFGSYGLALLGIRFTKNYIPSLVSRSLNCSGYMVSSRFSFLLASVIHFVASVVDFSL